MAARAIANSSMKSVETTERALPAFCMRLPLCQRGKIQEESMCQIGVVSWATYYP
jgi:hypothetical protein